MKRWGFAIVVAAILFAGAYFGSAYLAARRFKQAALSTDADQLDATVDFPAVRDSMKSQLSAIMMSKLQNDPEMKNNPFAGLGMMLGPVIIDKAVDAYITPDGISALVKGQKPNDGGSKDISPDIKADYEWLGIDRFRVKLTNTKTDTERPSLLFDRRGLFTWKLVKFGLPANLLDKPADPAPTAASTEPAPQPDPAQTTATPDAATTADTAIDPTRSIDQLEAQWAALNQECRGGDHSPADAVCKGRDDAEAALRRRDVCWEYSDTDVLPVDYKWHDCSEPRPTPSD